MTPGFRPFPLRVGENGRVGIPSSLAEALALAADNARQADFWAARAVANLAQADRLERECARLRDELLEREATIARRPAMEVER